LGEDVLASIEGLCFVKLVSY